MRIVLILDENKRITSACTALPNGNYGEMPIVDSIPTGNLPDYLYVDGEFIYVPLPEAEKPVEQPSLEERIKALETKVDGEMADQREALNLLGVYA